MQAIDYIRAGSFILGQLTGPAKVILFSQGYVHEIRAKKEGRANTVNAIHELRVAQVAWLQDHDAIRILNAFALERLLDSALPISLTLAILGDEVRTSFGKTMDTLPSRWHAMARSIKPIGKLLVPEQVRSEQPFDEIFTIEIRPAEGQLITAERIVVVVNAVQHLYTSVAKIFGVDKPDPLELLYAASGSPFRLDFKGLGEPIKQLKELLVEGWIQFRDRQPERLKSKAKALFETSAAFKAIADGERNKTMPTETANRFRDALTKETLRLFESGALPREVLRVEVVSNQAALDGVQPKLLPAPEVAPQTSAEDSQQKMLAGPESAKPKKKRAPRAAVKRPKPTNVPIPEEVSDPDETEPDLA